MIRTRVLILSDTHGEQVDYAHLPPVDIAIHCGDLTEESKLCEFHSAIKVLQQLKADTKLVIAGNHDFTLDQSAFQQKLAHATPPLDPQLVSQIYGELGAVEHLLSNEESQVRFLSEGTYRIKLHNGASLTVYASPYTASKSDWGFVYDPSTDHEWDIRPGTDIAITHSPPQGLLDYTDDRKRAGSASLFAAVAAIRPRLHCFGHIHEGWGAKLVHWRELPEGTTPTHFTAIDNDESQAVENLGTLTGGKFDTPDIVQEKNAKREACYDKGYCEAANVGLDSDHRTLFVNAAIESAREYEPHHLPWIVEIDLPSNEEGD